MAEKTHHLQLSRLQLHLKYFCSSRWFTAQAQGGNFISFFSSPFAHDRLDPTHNPLPERRCQTSEMKAAPFFTSPSERSAGRWLHSQLPCPFCWHLQHFMRCLNLSRHLTPANGFASQPINWLFTAGMSQNCRVKFSYPDVFCSEEHINPLLHLQLKPPQCEASGLKFPAIVANFILKGCSPDS